jgi:hypothetical protein
MKIYKNYKIKLLKEHISLLSFIHFHPYRNVDQNKRNVLYYFLTLYPAKFLVAIRFPN